VQDPIDPKNLMADRHGDCRCNPPTANMVPAPNGQGFGVISVYPKTQAAFPACGQHAEKEEDAGVASRMRKLLVVDG
jgi:hypothetical protein